MKEILLSSISSHTVIGLSRIWGKEVFLHTILMMKIYLG